MDKSQLPEHVCDVYVCEVLEKSAVRVRRYMADLYIDESTCTGNGTAFMNIFLSIPVRIPAPPLGRPHLVFPY